uniref:Uncharacterized protein n=1 Tax=Rhizophora mucronata TaxID=61149 RepID=A0A2P2NEQ6_RHIMU
MVFYTFFIFLWMPVRFQYGRDRLLETPYRHRLILCSSCIPCLLLLHMVMEKSHRESLQ